MSDWAAIVPPESAIAAEYATRRKLLPAGALGTWGPVLDQLAAMRGVGDLSRAAVDRIGLVVFAGDHGVAAAGVSAYPTSATADRITDLASGTGPIAALAANAGVTVRAVDMAVRRDLSTTAVDSTHRVRAASGRIDVEDALTVDELERSVAAGREIADAEVDSGAGLLIGAVCGVGVSTAVATLVSAVTAMEPVDATTRGSGIDDAGWITKCGIVRDARRRAMESYGNPRALLRIAGGADLAALTGFIAQAAVRRTPVLVDDVASLVCAVIANRLAPGSDAYLVAANTCNERTGGRLRQLLGIQPVADQRIGLGSGAGALLTVVPLRSAIELVDVAAAVGIAPDRTARAIDAWDADLL